MSLEDPSYGMLYYHAITIDPRVKKIICPPFTRRPFKNEDTKTEAKPDRSHLLFECYGCGAKDHGLGSCPVLNELINKGVIKQSPDNKYVMPDESRISRSIGETFAQAAQRQAKNSVPQQSSNFIIAKSMPMISTHETNQSTDDEEYNYAAERSVKSTKEKHL
jgi:hypothetical protein